MGQGWSAISRFVFQGIQQKRPSAAQNAILRRYFLELTQSFIIPLVNASRFIHKAAMQHESTRQGVILCVGLLQERYVASLMPLQKSISPWKSPPLLRPFVQQDFMKTLEKAGPQLTSRLKGDWIGLYRWELLHRCIQKKIWHMLLSHVNSWDSFLQAFSKVSQLWRLVPEQEKRNDPETGGSASRGSLWRGEYQVWINDLF